MVLSRDFINFSVISLIISCFARDFLLMALGKRLIEYSVVFIPTIQIVKFTIRFSTNTHTHTCTHIQTNTDTQTSQSDTDLLF